MDPEKEYIAVFDSGVGGISVLRQLLKQMPRERFLYFGDSANAPYGVRPTDQIRHLTLENARYLVSRGIKALVVACNTATSAAVNDLREAYPDLIVVGIEPALKVAADRFPGGCVGVLATAATLREVKFRALAAHCGEKCRIEPLHIPGIVELVEQGKGDSPEMDTLLRPYLAPYKGKLDALVLGCTHYPFAANSIRRILGDDVLLPDGGEGTARETKRRLEKAGALRTEGEGEICWENSSQDAAVFTLCQKLLEGSYGE